MKELIMIKALYILTLVLITGCSSTYQNKQPIDKAFPNVTGNTLTQLEVKIPEAFNGKNTLLLLGYRQNAQFDIDRWLIGLDMTKTQVDVYEIPAIQGFIPGLFSNQIDNGMRRGIPDELWSIVITVYKDGDTIQRFTGNENPNSARVVLLDERGKVIHFYDRGFSVSALNNLRNKLAKKQ